MGSSSNKSKISLPTESQLDMNKNAQNNLTSNLPSPSPTSLPVPSNNNNNISAKTPYDNKISFDKPTEKVKQNNNVNNNNINNIMPNQVQGQIPGQNVQNLQYQRTVPNNLPHGVNVPVYVQPVNQGYAMPYYPAQPFYPQPMPYYGPMPRTTTMVLPPGYHLDYSAGYSPWGNLREDLENLF